MGLGIVSDDEFDFEVSSLISSTRNEEKRDSEVRQIERGRGNKVETPEEIREIISEASLQGARSKDLAKIFPISSSSISAYKNSATSTASYNKPDQKLENHNSEVRDRITQRATKRIMMALSAITPEKVQSAKLKDISGLAKDMSSVVKNLEPQGRVSGDVNQTNYVFYIPKEKRLEDFETIVVNE
jgi:hypothetical protein